jgi:hypothetical protein
MKPRSILLFLFLAVPSLVWALADWVTSAVDEQVSVQAPIPLATVDMSKVVAAAAGASKEGLLKATDTKMLAARDASGVYMVLRLSGEIPGADFRRQQDRTEFFTGYIGSTVARDQGYLLERASFTVSGMEGVDFTYKGLHQFTKKMVVKHGRAFLVGKRCYSLVFIAADLQDSTGTSGTLERTRFFQSIVVKPDVLPQK